MALLKLFLALLPLLQLLLATQTFGPQEQEAFGFRVTLRKDNLQQVPSCVYTFAQLELLNLVRRQISDRLVI
jgi:hypothetical protein